MSKAHFKIEGIDCRYMGQTEYDYRHQAACGYVRENVTRNESAVDCFYCLNSVHMISYHASNKTDTDSEGCY